jgi:hypothetical protein
MAGAASGLPARRWRRRLASLERANPPPDAAAAAGIDPTVLTPEERWELGRIMAIVERDGLAGCSGEEVERLLCFRLKLEERSSECCLCGENV